MKGALVLVVDDFVDNREMYAEYLRFSGFRVEEAANGAEAVDRAKANPPDAAIMDLSLPEMDGWEATRLLKSDPRTKHVRVIALTGHALKGHSESAMQAGCDLFVTKPCLPEDLVKHLESLLEAPHVNGRPNPGRR